MSTLSSSNLLKLSYAAARQARRTAGAEHASLDTVAQETAYRYIEVARRRGETMGSSALYAIALNFVRDRRRRAGRRTRVHRALVYERSSILAAPDADIELRDLAARLLELLDPDDRQFLIIYAEHGATEACRVFGLRKQQAYDRLRSLRKFLRDQITWCEEF